MVPYRLLFVLILLHLTEIFFTNGVCTGSTSPQLLEGTSARFSDFSRHCLLKQQDIIATLEKEDSCSTFRQDYWKKTDSMDRMTGNGITAVLERGSLLEKGGVSTTITTGVLSAERAKAMSSRRKGIDSVEVGSSYFAAALSLVLHSKSPMVPTFRADIRYFELQDGQGWFGGGGDLTPYYLFDDDAAEFHATYRETCDKYSSLLYPRLKSWCDDYFYIPAREEHRGVGGIFFDDMDSIVPIMAGALAENESDKNILEVPNSVCTEDGLDAAMNFTYDVSETFMRSYLPIVRRRRDLPYTEEHRHWQLLRRGRYIEFNMLYDRGVKFGLVPGGRTEAVLVSCPPLVAWDYNHVPKVGSEEERLQVVLKTPRVW